MKKVAVITRTKDRPVFLKRAIKSVSAQTISDYEHVIVNDGGNSAEVEKVVNSFSEDTQKRIKVFHRNTASNAPDTIFNESIGRVESEYVAIHDDDDTWHPEMLERSLQVLESGAKGVVVRIDAVYEKFERDIIKVTKTKRYMPDMVYPSLYRQCLDNQLTAGGFVYSRGAYESVGKYDDSLAVAGDWEFGIRFLQKYDVEFLDPGFALAFYHKRSNVKDDSYTNRNHREVVTKIANKYLREDLDKGKLGIGYVMSNLKYEQDTRHVMIKRFLPKSLIKRIRR